MAPPAFAFAVMSSLLITARSWNVTWTKAPAGQSCTEACELGCLEDLSHYPTMSGKLDKILHEVHAGCKTFAAEGCHYEQQYTVSASHAHREYVAAEKKHCHRETFRRPRFSPSVDTVGHCSLHLWASTGVCSVKPPSTSSRICPCAPYDCVAGLENWKKGWSQAKKQWCCQNTNAGCQDDSSDADVDVGADVEVVSQGTYDCRAESEDWSEVWSLGSHTWCCSTEGYGCLEISGVVGGNARFAYGRMGLVVSSAKFVHDPQVVAALQRGVASMAGVEARTVGLQLGQASTEGTGEKHLRGDTMGERSNRKAISVVLNYTVPVPAAQGGVGNSGPIALASASVQIWEKVLAKTLAPVGEYNVTVTDASEVALISAESPLTSTPPPANNKSTTIPPAAPQNTSVPKEQVRFKATVEGVDYAAITAVPELKKVFEAAIQEITATDMNLDPSAVNLTLSSGSIIARGSMAGTPEDSSAIVSKFRAKQELMASQAEDKLASLPGLDKISTGTIKVTFILEEDEHAAKETAMEEKAIPSKLPVEEPAGKAAFAIGGVVFVLVCIAVIALVVKFRCQQTREITKTISSSALLDDEKDHLEDFRHEAFEPIKEKVLLEEAASPMSDDVSPKKPLYLAEEPSNIDEDEAGHEEENRSDPPEPTPTPRHEEEKKKCCAPCAPCGNAIKSAVGCGPCGGGRGVSDPSDTPAPAHLRPTRSALPGA